ncbi:hypothetical protein BGW36DRAFT_312011 [Talaromyces proteolyticus]|uniref:Uncharacterized protein n=1 Tax=Talaromyces proteolyticus TaxID=1131652 RepID=A0AAD4KY55_9EURO|nr:uncharacterized protein BGW36DRAFT_312011 [Talaromyces proteolyticus]KAH8703072.1 hypothetical protein BGW36DRAFT_312011 [Talaromyces proteolyticus]
MLRGKKLCRKLTVFGDPISSPACLLNIFSEYTCEDSRHRHPAHKNKELVNIHADGKDIELHLSLSDGTSRDDSYQPPLSSSYAVSEIAIICFATNSPESIESVEKKWIGQVLDLLRGVPIILVGCSEPSQSDTRTLQEPESLQQGRQLCKKIGGVSYLELSIDTSEGARELLNTVTQLLLLPRRQKKFVHCVVL